MAVGRDMMDVARGLQGYRGGKGRGLAKPRAGGNSPPTPPPPTPPPPGVGEAILRALEAVRGGAQGVVNLFAGPQATPAPGTSSFAQAGALPPVGSARPGLAERLAGFGAPIRGGLGPGVPPGLAGPAAAGLGGPAPGRVFGTTRLADLQRWQNLEGAPVMTPGTAMLSMQAGLGQGNLGAPPRRRDTRTRLERGR